MANQDPFAQVPGLDQMRQVMEQTLGKDGPFAAYFRNIDPTGIFQQGTDFSKSMFDIARGTSDIAPDKRDWRFQDDAWNSNPFYKRRSQAYLAMTDAVEAMIPDDLPWEEKARAQLAASIVTSTFAPTNTLIGNPAAISKTIETGGSNLAEGFKAFLDDLVNNGGMPRQVDSTPFEVGRNLALTPGKIVLQTPMFELIHYAPSTD